MNTAIMPQTPDEIIKLGEKIYFQKFEELKKDIGKFVVINTETEEYIVGQDKTQAIQTAEEKFPGKLFFIAQIGNLKAQPSVDEARSYALPF